MNCLHYNSMKVPKANPNIYNIVFIYQEWQMAVPNSSP